MRTGWLKDPKPNFHIPCGQWFRKKGQRHDCKVKKPKKLKC